MMPSRREQTHGQARRPWGRLGIACAALLFGLGANAASDPTAESARGAVLMRERNCFACHRLGGEGGEVGPALDQVMLRRDEAWLRRWLADPPAMKPGTLMPQYGWSEDDLRALFAYLASFRRPVNAATLLASAPSQIEAGRRLIEAYQCGACHRVAGLPGRPIYPDLETVKNGRTPDWERRWLADPQAVKPGTFMPRFSFSAREIEAIVAYLMK